MSSADIARPPRPVPFQGDLANLPDALAPLKALPNWVCWKWEWRVSEHGVGKWTKPPLRPDNRASYARNNDPKTWGSYEQALAALEAGQCDGIGFCFQGTDIAAFDLDDCRDAATGAIAPEAMAIVERSASYTEMTPSGTGLRVIGYGSGGDVQRKQKIPGSAVKVESYRNTARYITITGNPLPGTPLCMINIDGAIDAVVAELSGGTFTPQGVGGAHNEGGKPNGAGDKQDWRSDLDKWIEANGDRYASPDDFKEDGRLLPAKLKAIIANVPPAIDLSAAFHHTVCWLHFDLKWSADRIDYYIDDKPVMPVRYIGRLKQEIYRCLHNAEQEKARRRAKTEQERAKAEEAQEPLQWLDMSNWDDEPVPERQWAIKDRVPLNQVGLFSGEGGTGKSIIELMKNVAHVAGKDWFGSTPEIGPTFYLGAEDAADEIHIRLADIARHYGVTFKQLIEGGLHILPLLGKDAVLCASTGKSGRVEPTALYKQIYQAAGDLKPINISVDTLTRAFAGNEIDRVEVYGFAMHMQALAMVAGGSVTILSHPSLAGMASGSGLSGSTAWHGAFRFRMYLKGAKADEGDQPDDDLREFEFKKNQYGPRGQSMVLRYRGGLFLPEAGSSPLEKVARASLAERVFMELLRQLAEQGRNVSDKKTSPNYAPAAFAKEAAAKQYTLRPKPDFEPAMLRLFDARKIRVETYGRPSRTYSRLVAVTPMAMA